MRDLHLWSPGGVDLEPIKTAKAALGVDYLIKPRYVDSLEQLPSFDTRVLAFGSRPDFLCEYALTSERTGPEGWVRALSWVLGETPEDPKATTMLDTLNAILGPGVREVTPEELDGERKLRDYMQNRV